MKAQPHRTAVDQGQSTLLADICALHNHAAMMAGWFMTYGETRAGALVMTMVNEA